MKVGLVSDTHGDVRAWERIALYLRDCDLVIHSGDVLYHGIFNPILESYKPFLLAEEMNKFTVPIHFSRGNCDSEVDQLALNYPLASPYLVLSLGGFTILAHHGHIYSQDELLKLAKKWRVNLLLTGHTHSYQLKKEGGLVLVNPGSPSLPKDGKPPTLAVLEEAMVRIVNLEDGTFIDEASLF